MTINNHYRRKEHVTYLWGFKFNILPQIFIASLYIKLKHSFRGWVKVPIKREGLLPNFLCWNSCWSFLVWRTWIYVTSLNTHYIISTAMPASPFGLQLPSQLRRNIRFHAQTLSLEFLIFIWLKTWLDNSTWNITWFIFVVTLIFKLHQTWALLGPHWTVFMLFWSSQTHCSMSEEQGDQNSKKLNTNSKPHEIDWL